MKIYLKFVKVTTYALMQTGCEGLGDEGILNRTLQGNLSKNNKTFSKTLILRSPVESQSRKLKNRLSLILNDCPFKLLIKQDSQNVIKTNVLIIFRKTE